MEQAYVDRRRARRMNVQAPLWIRQAGSQSSDGSKQELTRNLGLAGVYFETNKPEGYQAGDVVIASVSIPEPETRRFPFTRLAGRGRIVRVIELSRSGPTVEMQFGIALEFAQDVTALTAVPSRG